MPALITRCPACATMFKVVPDQLRVSEGWVRCGHCNEVFDASAHLQEPADLAHAQAAARSAAGADSGLSGSSPAAAAADREPRIDSQPPADVASEVPSEPPSETAYDSSLLSPGDEVVLHEELDPAELDAEARRLRLVEDPLDRPFQLRREDLSGPGELMASPPAPRSSELDSELDSELQSELEPADEPTFVREARRQARWSQPGVRALLLLALLALAVLLALQVALQERDRLAAAQPALRPWLVQLCAAAGCRIAPPRQIDAIAIDSSSFNKVRPDAYRLQVTLKNQARTPIAMPALELTLTDTDEQPVVRRVLMPGDFAAGRAAIGPASDWSGSIGIGVTDNALAGRISGYRVLAFYP
jgi:predicted Zn finger-like uncharacterized protein